MSTRGRAVLGAVLLGFTVGVTAMVRPATAQCPGDCNGNAAVSAAELTKVITIINMCPCSGGLIGGVAAGCPAVPGTDKQCTAADRNGNSCLSAAELTLMIQNLVNFPPSGCPVSQATATPTTGGVTPPPATFTPTATLVPTLTPTTVFTATFTPTTAFTPTSTATPLAPTVTPTPTSAPSVSPVSINVGIAPGGGSPGSCRGTCSAGLRSGEPCGTSAECLRGCVGGPTPGLRCTANSQCGNGGTCPTANCNNKVCAGGPLNGTACASASNCNACLLTPPQGSCAVVQNPLFPVIVPLNGVCENAAGLRFNPPGDIQCTTDAECATCVGGTNAGKTCRPTTASVNDCPDGTCSGSATCKLGRFTLNVGASDPVTQEAPLTVDGNSLFLSPAVVSGIGTVCVTSPNSTAIGKVDCNGGRANLNTLSERDHNTLPGKPGNYGMRCKNGSRDGLPCTGQDDCPGEGAPGVAAYCAGLPDDAECDDTVSQPDGSTSRACVEGTRRCSGGANDGLLCKGFSSQCRAPSTCWSIDGNPPFTCKGGPDDGTTCTQETLECPGGACTPCNTGTGDGPHPGICNSPTYVTQSATFDPADMAVGFPLALTVNGSGCPGGQASGCFGPDGLACTSDDQPTSPPSPVGVPLSTGTNRIYVMDASNTDPAAGNAISPETMCTASPCIAQVAGAGPASCEALRAGNVDGVILGGGFPAFDTTAGDIATTFQFVLKKLN